MIRAIRAVSIERGRDARDYTLCAFGGNGPVFACAMAQELGMRRIVVPPSPGLFSAFGLLYADVEHHYARTFRRLLRELDLAALDAGLAGARAPRPGASSRPTASTPAAIRIRRLASLHYQGQTFDLTVPVADGPLDPATLARLEEAFGQEHERTYGHRAGPEEPVELTEIRLIGQGIPEHPLRPQAPGARVGRHWPTRSRCRRAAPISAPRPAGSRRRSCAAATSPAPRDGPCIVEEYDATCVIPPGARASLDRFGNILIEL